MLSFLPIVTLQSNDWFTEGHAKLCKITNQDTARIFEQKLKVIAIDIVFSLIRSYERQSTFVGTKTIF